MNNNYLDIPLNFKLLKQKSNANRVSTNSSIHNMIHLILTSSFGELKFDDRFGFDLWQHDFDNVYNVNIFKEELRKSVIQSIEDNEKRIKNVKVELEINQILLKVMNKRTKVRVKLTINGLTEKTNEQFSHEEMFYIGPLSYN